MNAVMWPLPRSANRWICVNLKKPMAAINVGLESFAANLKDQDAPNIHVDWKPPAGGNEKLAEHP